MLVVPGENHISDMTNDKAYTWFGVGRHYVDTKHLGGTFYGFNFNNPKTVECFNLWKEAEQAGVFGNQQDFMEGHWCDESCMALAMHVTGIEQKRSETFQYKNQKEMPL